MARLPASSDSAAIARDRGARSLLRLGWPFWLYLAHLLTVHRLALSNILLGVTLLVVLWLERGRSRELFRELRPAAPVLVPLGFYLLFQTVSVVFAVSWGPSLRSFSEWFSLTTLVFGIVVLRGERAVRLAVDALTAAAGIFSTVGLAQYMAGSGGIDERIIGPFPHWMTFSGVLLVADLLLLGRLFFGPGWRGGWGGWRIVAAVAINAALVVSLTRNAWVGLGAASIVLIALRKPRWLVLAVPMALIGFVVVPVPVIHRATSITDLSDPSNYDRLCMAAVGLDMIAERPLLGIGPNQVRHRYPIYRHPTAPRSWVPHLHNSGLHLAAERGVPALGAYLWLNGAAALLALWRFRREGGAAGPRADLWAGAFLAIIAFNVAGLFENNWGDTEVQRMALFALAVPVALCCWGDFRTDSKDGIREVGPGYGQFSL